MITSEKQLPEKKNICYTCGSQVIVKDKKIGSYKCLVCGRYMSEEEVKHVLYYKSYW